MKTFSDDNSDAASTTSTIFTPQTTSMASTTSSCDQPHDKCVPWPGNTYQITLKNTNKAITLNEDKVSVQELKKTELHESNPDTHWLCVEKNGYFGFQNPKSGRYIGHNGKDLIHALQWHCKEWEYFTPRKNPDGGYQLLSPNGGRELKLLCVDWDGNGIIRRCHGVTLWEFVRVHV